MAPGLGNPSSSLPGDRPEPVTRESIMGPWLGILILAVIFAVLGFAGIANWLFIVAVVLLVAGVVMAITSRASRL